MDEMELDFDFIPTVRVGAENGTFSAEVIELYELPHEQVMRALGTPNGPAQMMAMLEIFKLAVVDQSKLSGLEILSFSELADLLGQWAILSTPPSSSGSSEFSTTKRPKIFRKIKGGSHLSRSEMDNMIEMVLSPETSLDELIEISEKILMSQYEEEQEDQEEKPRGRHAKPYDSEFDGPLNDPGDGVEPF
jgi:hypothetical protein